MSRFDLYANVHKGVRAALTQAASLAVRTDFSNPTEAAEAARVARRLVFQLENHARHEDTHVMPLLARVAPEVHADLQADHARTDGLQRELAELADRLHDAPAAQRIPLGRRLHDGLWRLAAEHLRHLDREESGAMRALWAHFTDEELAAVQGRIVATIPPDTLAEWSRHLAPGRETCLSEGPCWRRWWRGCRARLRSPGGPVRRAAWASDWADGRLRPSGCDRPWPFGRGSLSGAAGSEASLRWRARRALPNRAAHNLPRAGRVTSSPGSPSWLAARRAAAAPSACAGIGARVEAGGRGADHVPAGCDGRAVRSRTWSENGRDGGGLTSRSTRSPQLPDQRTCRVARSRRSSATAATSSDIAVPGRPRWAQVGLPPRITLRMAHWPAQLSGCAWRASSCRRRAPAPARRLGRAAGGRNP